MEILFHEGNNNLASDTFVSLYDYDHAGREIASVIPYQYDDSAASIYDMARTEMTYDDMD